MIIANADTASTIIANLAYGRFSSIGYFILSSTSLFSIQTASWRLPLIVFFPLLLPAVAASHDTILYELTISHNLRKVDHYTSFYNNTYKRNYLFLYVNIIPTIETKNTTGASLTYINSKPCKIVPATASSGLL